MGKSFLIELKCTNCGTSFNPEEKHGLCTKCSKILYSVYDLEEAKEYLTKSNLVKRKRKNIWRMHEIMPVFDEKYRFTLGEGNTPLLKLKNLGDKFQLNDLLLKDEGQNPTHTFKSRGLCAAVSKAVELGVNKFVIPTAGNAGAALASYTARSQTKAHIFMPKDSSVLIQKEITAMGGELRLVDGLISDAGKISNKSALENDWFDVSTLKEPYRVEGKKTMGLELAEDLEFNLPDVIIYPTGGGTGIVGMMKAFNELEEIGLIGNERPRMISVQASNCAPIVRAFNEGNKHAEPWEDADTFASGLRVPSAIGDYLILKAVRETKGTAVAVSDNLIRESMRDLAKIEGIMLAPEAAACIASLDPLIYDGKIDKDEKIVIFGTGSGLTTPEEW